MISTETYVAIDLATTNFIASGGDDFTVFTASSESYETGWLLPDALAEYLDVKSPIAPIR